MKLFNINILLMQHFLSLNCYTQGYPQCEKNWSKKKKKKKQNLLTADFFSNLGGKETLVVYFGD